MSTYHDGSPQTGPHPGMSAPKTPQNLPSVGLLRKQQESTGQSPSDPDESRISAYARLDFDNYTFFVQTLQVVLGRKSHNELLQTSHHTVDVHLSSKKAISRRHAKIFYNFGTQRFEISVLGRNGAFVDDSFIEKGLTIPLQDSTKIQIGDISFRFVLPSAGGAELGDRRSPSAQLFNPTDALNLRTNLYSKSVSPPRKMERAGEKDGRRSSKADLVRKLSIARRKSLASSSNDEISALLKELEAFDEEPFDPALFEAEKKDDELSKEKEKEIDQLVSQHSKPLDVDISMLDQEMATLAPLLDAEEKKPKGALMGKPAVPRMGKPATIQPMARYRPQYQNYPANYQNQNYQSQNYQNQNYPNQTYPAQNYPYGYPYTRPPPPKLEVSVETITHISVSPSVVPYKPITVDGEYMERPSVCTFKSVEPVRTEPKIPVRRKDPLRKPPKVQNLKDTPEQYKSKPTVSISAMITGALRRADNRGSTVVEIHDNIKELYPYYRYCPDGWQATVTHNVKFNKLFAAISKPLLESEWLWAVDEKYIEEKEATRKKQQEVAMAKAKEAAMRAVDYRQRQNMSPYRPGRPFAPDFGRYQATPANPNAVSSNAPVNTVNSNGSSPGLSPGLSLQKPKSIAEIASEIKRDTGYSTPLYFQKGEKAEAEPKEEPKTQAKDPKAFNTDTKKSLEYLQKELFTLYKARKLSYNTTTTTEIITKALATTIAQVNIIGAKAGCGDNALVFLVEKAPQQVSKILDIALTKSIKEKQGSSAGSSRSQTPVPDTPKKPTNSGPTNSGPAPGPASSGPAPGPNSASAPGSGAQSPLNKPSFGLSRPGFSGLSKPQSFSKPGLTKPPQFLSNKSRAEKRPSEETDSSRKVMKTEETN